VPGALFRLGRCDFALSQKATTPKAAQVYLADAVKNYELIREKFPKCELLSELTFQLGYLYAYHNDGDTAKSLALFQEFVQRWPKDRLVPEALYQIAHNEFAQSKFDTAISTYKQLIDKYPNYELASFAVRELAAAYRNVGNEMLRQGRFPQAQDAFESSLALDTTDTNTVTHTEISLAEASLGLHDLDDAKKTFNEVLTANAHDVDAEADHLRVYLSQEQDYSIRVESKGSTSIIQTPFLLPSAVDEEPNAPYRSSPAGSTPKGYPAHISTPSADVTGVVNEEINEITRSVSSLSDVGLAPLIGMGEAKIDAAGVMGPGGDIFAARIGPQRTIDLNRFQGTAETEKAVLAALRWLKANQERDGSWKCGQSPPAGTALATLAFLGHGETPDSPEFGQTVGKGLQYLIQHIDSNGLIGGVSQDYIGYGYSQGPVVLALAEGYAMTQSPALREPLDRALQAVFREQAAAKTRPQDVGGWRNQSLPNDSDVSVTGWMIMALKSARAAGIEVPQAVFNKATQYLWNMYDTKNPGFGYQKPERYPTMTAIGVLCQQFLGNGKDPRIEGALDYLREQKVEWDKTEGDFVLYGWYCMTQAMFQGGDFYWRYWNTQIRDTMVRNQQEDGRWMPPPNSNIEGRDLAKTPAYSTALGALILEVYYRYLPIHQIAEPSGEGGTATTAPKSGPEATPD
jgi:tetratricopeptide (TPR) repeat protein